MTTRRLLYPFALLPVFALAACGDAPDDAVTTQTQPDGSTTMQIQVPEQLAPAAEAIANPDQALEELRRNAGDMSEDAKVQAVAAARATAEQGARLLGQTDEQIRQAGDSAEERAREALGMQ